MRADAPPRGAFEFEPPSDTPAFNVDLDGFEGPLDLLLELARRQKVDLARISVLKLAEQYLAFVEAARKQRLELAADYLVMAAWLAYLKSRLLLPQPPQAAGPDASELADALARRLRKLEAIRKAAGLLGDRVRLGRDVFARGEPEAIEDAGRTHWDANLFDLLAAYARQAQKHARARVRFQAREVWSLAEAREALVRLSARPWTGPPSTASSSRPASSPESGGAPAHRPSRPPSNSRAKARSNSGRTRPSRRYGSAARRAAQAGEAAA